MLTIYLITALIFIWLFLELIVRWVAQKGVGTDFYGSIKRDEVRSYQQKFGVKVVTGSGWTHLGWIADPEKEAYVIEKRDENENWRPSGTTQFGSWLTGDASGTFQVVAINKKTSQKRTIGCVELVNHSRFRKRKGFSVPEISSNWHTLFRPEKTGKYINDHCIFQDNEGKWRLIGITSHSVGDYRKECYFASAKGDEFPPKQPFKETAPIAKFGELAWAPDVVVADGMFHLFWSPHQLHHMNSDDGIKWRSDEIVLEKPFHKFFRDAMIFKVAPNQWLLYATGRGKLFSRVDIYQSFDLVHWQYIRPAIRSSWGSEKNFVTGSMESPFLIPYKGNYYLSMTYNNESFFLSAMLLQIGKFLKKKDYNNTLIFGSENPYDFSVYRGRKRTPNLITQLKTHAPVYVQSDGQWYLTTCGWPFAASITTGEVAWARLDWDDEI